MPDFDNNKTVKEILHDCMESLKKNAKITRGEIKDLDGHNFASLTLPDGEPRLIGCSTYGTPLEEGGNGETVIHGIPDTEKV